MIIVDKDLTIDATIWLAPYILPLSTLVAYAKGGSVSKKILHHKIKLIFSH